MKKLQREGVGAKKRQVEVLTEANEELMWSKGLLGDTTPQSLLDTVIFYNGLYFALRSVKEHRQLRSSRCEIEVIEHPGEGPFLLHRRHLQESSRRPKMKKHTSKSCSPPHQFRQCTKMLCAHLSTLLAAVY